MSIWTCRRRPILDSDLLEILAPGLCTALLVTVVHAPLGIEVLKRGIVFIDLATAQVVGLAVILSSLWLDGAFWFERQAIAFGAGLAIAAFFRWIEHVTPDEQEAVIGSCFIVASSLVLLALAGHPTGGDMLQHVLSGQLLFVTWSDIAAFLPIYGIYALLWLCVPRLRTGTGFFLLFALVVTASMQLVGVYVVFASLILPALAARRAQGYSLARALASGAVAAIIAVVLSGLWDLPAGPFLVVCLAGSAVVTRLVHRVASGASR